MSEYSKNGKHVVYVDNTSRARSKILKEHDKLCDDLHGRTVSLHNTVKGAIEAKAGVKVVNGKRYMKRSKYFGYVTDLTSDQGLTNRSKEVLVGRLKKVK